MAETMNVDVAMTKQPAPEGGDMLNGEILSKQKLQELVRQMDPDEKLDPEVEELMIEIADDFIESVTSFSCNLAKHRGSKVLEVRDIKKHLDVNWGIRIPGFSGGEIEGQVDQNPQTDIHKKRMAKVKEARRRKKRT